MTKVARLGLRARSFEPWRSLSGSVAARNAVGFSATVFTFLLLLTASSLTAQTSYYRHSFFDNAPRTAAYSYTTGKAVEPSTLETENGKLPVESKTFFTPPNAIRLSWQSKPGGSWAAAIHV